MTDDGVKAQTTQKSSSSFWRRKTVIIAAAAVVTIGVTAGLIAPQAAHAKRVAAYTELAEEMRAAANELAEAETTLQAAQALTHAHHTDALSLANAVVTLREAKEPVLSAERAEMIGTAGVTAVEALGPVPELDGDVEESHTLLLNAYVEAKEAENAEEVDEPTLPASIVGVDLGQAVQFIAAPISPSEVPIVSDDAVTAEDIEEIKSAIASVRADIERTQETIDAEVERQDFLGETLGSLLPVLQETAATIDEHAEAVQRDAAKADADVAKKTAEAAQHLQETADAEDVVLLKNSIAAYVSAGEASIASHAEVVRAEEEAEARRLAEEQAAAAAAEAAAAAAAAAAAPSSSASQGSSSGDGWASGGLCNYWAPMGGGMYMAPC